MALAERMSDLLPPCPITGRPARRRVHGVFTWALLAMWRVVGAGDLSHLFPEAPQVVLYESDTGLYFFTPAVAGDAGFYQHFYATHAAHATLSAHSEARREFVNAARYITAGSQVLDVGCGSGAFREHLPLGTYRGLDPYAEAGVAADVIRQSLPEHVDEARGRYDAVTAFQVIEHVADPLCFHSPASRPATSRWDADHLRAAAPLATDRDSQFPDQRSAAPPHLVDCQCLPGPRRRGRCRSA